MYGMFFIKSCSVFLGPIGVFLSRCFTFCWLFGGLCFYWLWSCAQLCACSVCLCLCLCASYGILHTLIRSTYQALQMKIIYIFYLCDTAAVIMLINTHCALLNKALNISLFKTTLWFQYLFTLFTVKLCCKILNFIKKLTLWGWLVQICCVRSQDYRAAMKWDVHQSVFGTIFSH